MQAVWCTGDKMMSERIRRLSLLSGDSYSQSAEAVNQLLHTQSTHTSPIPTSAQEHSEMRVGGAQ